MPTQTAPVKTPLGQDELRHRTRGLGQRYRTILLLVDGNRPLGQVLAMAHQAGAQTSHFEELVRLGLVEVPNEAAAPEPMETAPGALDTPRLTSVNVDVMGDEEALTPMGALLPEELASELDSDSDSDTGPDTVADGDEADAAAVDVDRRPSLLAPATQAAATAPAAPPAATVARYVEPTVTFTDSPRAPDWTQQVRETPFKVADHARPAPSMSEAQRMQYVRDLLLDTLRRDSLLFATFSVARVRVAQTQRELIKLVWEIERDRSHMRRSRDQLLNLQRARELLGMGNTLVAGDSQPGAPSSEY